jgi:hypothetical protein
MKTLELNKMSLAYIKGSELPLALLQRFNFKPEDNLIVKRFDPIDESIDYDDDGKPMPLEDHFKKEFIEAVEISSKQYKEGKCNTFETMEDLFEHLDNL